MRDRDEKPRGRRRKKKDGEGEGRRRRREEQWRRSWVGMHKGRLGRFRIQAADWAPSHVSFSLAPTHFLCLPPTNLWCSPPPVTIHCDTTDDVCVACPIPIDCCSQSLPPISIPSTHIHQSSGTRELYLFHPPLPPFIYLVVVESLCLIELFHCVTCLIECCCCCCCCWLGGVELGSIEAEVVLL